MTRYTALIAPHVDQVYFNGEKVSDVVEADDEIGFIIQAVKGEDGRLVLDGDNIKHVVRVGSVAVTMRSD